jgi:glutamine---fructose-6-phosphate transaminase (isomerizing)
MNEDAYLRDLQAQPETLEWLCAEYTSGEWAASLQKAARMIRSAAKPVCFTGMGASYFALLAARPTFDRLGLGMRIEDTAYLLEYGQQTLEPGQPIVLVSQSGRSVEVTRFAQALSANHPLIIITNDPNTELAHKGDVVLSLLAASDHGVALKTYTATAALLLLLGAAVADGSIEEVAGRLTALAPMNRAIAQAERFLPEMMEFCRGSEYVTLLGRGPSIASALGGALLLKETAKIPAEGAPAGQFRHGAVEVVQRDSLVMLFAPAGRAQEFNAQLVGELEKYGARVLIIGQPPAFETVSKRLVVDIEAPADDLAPIFEIVPLQLLSHALAKARGVEPGSFVNTTPVITTM